MTLLVAMMATSGVWFEARAELGSMVIALTILVFAGIWGLFYRGFLEANKIEVAYAAAIAAQQEGN